MSDPIVRCDWAVGDPKMEQYHDNEWGTPSHDDLFHFEMLTLEGAQAGLSWRTILNRREGYRKAFADFDPNIVVKFTESDFERLMQDTGIIRNRAKIRSTISNAAAFLKLQEEFDSFDTYLWQWVDGKPLRIPRLTIQDLPAKTELSGRISKDLLKRGFKFVGSTIIYSHLQAVGVVNDHIVDCFRSKLTK